MEDSKDADSSVLVLIVRSSGDREVAVEAFRSNDRGYRKMPGKRNSLPVSAIQDLLLPGRKPASVTQSRHHRIRQAVRFINENYRTDICLADVAEEAGMSLAHFSRTFKKVMGVSYQGYLNSRRITKAKNLLRATSKSIADIADSLGFADSTGFGRIFKKLTGQTPSVYRMSAQK